MSGPAMNGANPAHPAGASLRQTVTVCNPQGLHMRPASAFAKRASEFNSSVTVIHAERAVNGKSQLDLLMLAAEAGAQLELQVSGDDAAQAMPVLAELLAGPCDPETD